MAPLSSLVATSASKAPWQQQQQQQQQRLADWKVLIDNGNPAASQSSELSPPANATAAATDSAAVQLPNQPPQTPPGSGGNGSRGSSDSSSSSSSSSDLLPVYCGVLGCLIVGLVAWIVFKHLRGRPSQEDKQQQQQQQLPGDEVAMHLQPQQQQHLHRQSRRHHQAEADSEQPQQPQQLLFHFPLASAKRRSADSGFWGSEEASAVGDFGVGVGSHRRLLRDLSESRLQRLENILANDPNPDGWRRLARELGLGSDTLAKLECQSRRGNQSAIRLMLKTWAARNDASVGQLTRCLQRAGRSDALILFRESAVPPALLRRAQQKRQQQEQQQQQEQEQEEQQQQQQEQQQEEQQQEQQDEQGRQKPQNQHQQTEASVDSADADARNAATAAVADKPAVLGCDRPTGVRQQDVDHTIDV